MKLVMFRSSIVSSVSARTSQGKICPNYEDQ